MLSATCAAFAFPFARESDPNQEDRASMRVGDAGFPELGEKMGEERVAVSSGGMLVLGSVAVVSCGAGLSASPDNTLVVHACAWLEDSDSARTGESQKVDASHDSWGNAPGRGIPFGTAMLDSGPATPSAASWGLEGIEDCVSDVLKDSCDGNFERAEANGKPCSGAATTYERLVGAEFFLDIVLQMVGFMDRVERVERGLDGIDSG